MKLRWLKKAVVGGVILGISLATYPLTCLAMQCPTLKPAQDIHACCHKQQNESPVKLKANCCQENQAAPEINLTSNTSFNEKTSVSVAAVSPIFLPPLQGKIRILTAESGPPGPSLLSLHPVLRL